MLRLIRVAMKDPTKAIGFPVFFSVVLILKVLRTKVRKAEATDPWELLRDVPVLARKFRNDELVPQTRSFIVKQLLKDLLSEKASKDHVYVTSLKKIGKGEIKDETGDFFHVSVVFDCITFLPYRGEI
ncbi:RNA polymerase Rpb7, N-terminal [Parasponia andersonii]|uniref:RNA polymerase Rpb7, N-terminal n=1 Tax=Parasponia andersonii TaxID=3476 RepID=A0A2P5BWV0_PARAD|nr:RNA polymerase Rpb7, N-terminal [Parasponia andersonii]